MGPFFSIIIPVYNGEQCIGQCLDSIYTQGLCEDDFEVICVNDASIDNTAKVISAYGLSHKNLRLITHEKNRRQGAARNTGVRAAIGDYILYIDADDTFLPDALIQLKEELERNKGLDIMKFDYVIVENGVGKEYRALSDSQERMSGRNFMKRNSIPWVPWLCSYSRQFLIKNDLFFVENVQFEDMDYSIACFVTAQKIKYSPILVYRYEVNDSPSTTKVGVNVRKVIEIFELNRRIGNIYQKEIKKNEHDAAEVVKAHYDFGYKSMILRYWWRLSYKDRKELLIQYKPMLPYQDRLIAFIGTYPRLFLYLSAIAKPFLPSIRLVYLKVKGRA